LAPSSGSSRAQIRIMHVTMRAQTADLVILGHPVPLTG
jgi:hypothetical protein